MRENSDTVLFPEYKKAKKQHKKRNMPRRSDLNQAKNVIKEFEHPSIQGQTMYSSVIGGSNEEGTWRSTDSAANTDGPATMSDLHSLIQAFISSKKAVRLYPDGLLLDYLRIHLLCLSLLSCSRPECFQQGSSEYSCQQ
ncbi:hypothetical protein F2Q68_00004015 [Brassica cretica]|uniref:Uncharacterized protein n=1 Tax=Brassica cretica TaxID=69181 RepID=A0A8S9JE16_BRACR|nr:hypothetical protein F2Q68_00004015 [Brassica cretica]